MSRVLTIKWMQWLAVAVFLASSAYGQLPASAEGSGEATATVRVGDRVLFDIRTKLGPFSPAERAAAANRKIARLVKDVLVSPDIITSADQGVSTDVLAGDVVITTITDADAEAAAVERSVLAAEYVRDLRAGVVRVRAEYSFKTILLGTLYAGVTTALLVMLLMLLKRYSPLLYAAIDRWRGTKIRTVKIQSLELVSAARITEILIQLARLLRVFLTLTLFYFYIPLVFSFFPWTRSFGATLLDYVFHPIGLASEAFVSYLPSMMVILLIIVFSYLVIRLARFIFTELERGTISWPGFYPDWAMPTFRIVEILVLAFAVVVMFPYLPGSDSPAFKGVSIFLGVLFSLGSSSAVANVVAGVILTYARAFRVGDRVQIADTVGDVVSKTLLATHVRTIKNVHITVPNSLVLGSHIINFSASAVDQPLILNTSVTIGYDAPWRQVHEVLIRAAHATGGVLREPFPFVFQTSLDDFYVSYQLNAYTRQPGRMAAIYSDLHQNIQDSFNEAGIEIMSPHYHAVRDGNTTTTPGSYLPPDYVPQSFRVQHQQADVKAPSPTIVEKL